ncbi:homoserine kinase [Halarsenatibacter silvermanii]|uniref:Homoserine kinase n=1 Tax=Halarsenatibacter silvermanii TaxID=321763 RepID=A0A1G9J4H3_9FIRM|nr:homoserine kinase [Halarsenatibacter silvermanii]SDL32064.1 homoserine kinase [Halarsenatibacter silvermanii]
MNKTASRSQNCGKEIRNELSAEEDNLGIKVRVPSTSANLGPGFDSLGVALNIDNYVQISPLKGAESGENQIISEVFYADNKKLNIASEEDLIRQTLQQLRRYTDRGLTGARIKQELYCSPAQGLGSSAVAIVGTLKAAVEFFELELSTEEILRLACRIETHPDNVVPATLGGLTVSSYSLEEKDLVWDRVIPHESMQMVVIIPELTSNTKEQRKVIPDKFEMDDVCHNLSRTALLPLAFKSGDYDKLRKIMKDRLHQPYRCSAISGWNEVMAAGYESGAQGIALSGAGPTILAIVRENPKAVGRAMVKAWRREGVESEFTVTEPDEKGCYVIEEE